MLSRGKALPRRIAPETRKAGLAAFTGAIAVAALGIVAAAGAPKPGASPTQPASGATSGPTSTASGTTEIQLLGVNDFHGHLESPTAVPRQPGGPAVAVGGAAALDAHLDRAARGYRGRTIRVHAGDMAGATPLISSHFHDEPSVRAANLMGFDVGTLGNHEFDEGGDELIRLLRGGQRRDSRQFKRDQRGNLVNTSDPGYEGAEYPYVAANTVDREGELALPPTKVVERDGARIGFIGVTTNSTPRFLLAEHSSRFRWLDISTVVNRHAAELQRQGVEAIVVLAHSGAFQETASFARGEIIDETREMTGAVDVVIAGHSQTPLDLRVPNRDGGGDKLVVQALAYGTAYDRVRMRIDRRTGQVLRKRADTPRTWNDEVSPGGELPALVERYRRALGGLGTRVLGRAEVSLERKAPGEHGGNLGTVAARAQRRLAGADFGFVDGGNMRASVDAGPITYAELFEAHAYEHPVMRMRLRGDEVRGVLEQQFEQAGEAVLHVDGLTYERRGVGVGQVLLPDGSPLDPDAVYTVAANRLLVDKGEIDVFRLRGRGMRPVGTDLEALEAEVERSGVVR